MKVRCVASVTPSTFEYFLSGSTWLANFTCGCRWCSLVSNVKSVTVNLAVDTVSFVVVDVVEHLRQIYVEAID